MVLLNPFAILVLISPAPSSPSLQTSRTALALRVTSEIHHNQLPANPAPTISCPFGTVSPYLGEGYFRDPNDPGKPVQCIPSYACQLSEPVTKMIYYPFAQEFRATGLFLQKTAESILLAKKNEGIQP
jgi:hypothetical protein